MKRIGYIGLSTPTFYDYQHKVSRAPSDTSDSPNPVVEGAFGAMLLYDELWFLCRSLCPENMRELSYVRFLDEKGQVPDVDRASVPRPDSIFHADALEIFRTSSSRYADIKAKAKVYWDAAADNHTHGLLVNGQHLSGNSWSVENVLFDMSITEKLGKNVELITNSFTSKLFRTEARVGDRLELTEALVLSDVPQFLSPLGPYHACIDDVRGSAFLESFRSWVAGTAFTAGSVEIAERKAEVEAKLRESVQKVFLQYLDRRGTYTSLAETVLGTAVDALVPGISTLKDLAKQGIEERKKEGMRWQGFILDARSKIDQASVTSSANP